MDAPMDSPPEDAPPPPPQAQTQGQKRAETKETKSAVSFASARMLDAQGVFQRAVKQELQLLLVAGVSREDAVRLLLHRIVEATDAPEPAAVRSVMRQFQMNRDDAVRALIVKQELGRLKRKGLDSFAAIEELTRKMQRVPSPSAADTSPPPDTALSHTVGKSSDAVASSGVEETKETDAGSQAVDVEVDAVDVAIGDTKAEEGDASTPDAVVARVDQVEEEAAAAEKDVEKQLNLSSLTLCQRIDKVSISSAAARASLSGQLDGDEALRDAETQSPRPAAGYNSGASASTPPPSSHRHSRKRRAPFGLHGRSSTSNSTNNGSDGSMSPERHVAVTSSSLSSLSHDLHPSVKKQKLRDVGDGFLSVLSRKTKHLPPPESPAASSSDSDSSRAAVARVASTNLVKRPRSKASALMASDSEDDSPLLEHEDALLVRHRRHRAKRHKTAGSISTTTDNSSGGRLHASP